jgi:hypothetical protein
MCRGWNAKGQSVKSVALLFTGYYVGEGRQKPFVANAIFSMFFILLVAVIKLVKKN